MDSGKTIPFWEVLPLPSHCKMSNCSAAAAGQNVNQFCAGYLWRHQFLCTLNGRGTCDLPISCKTVLKLQKKLPFKHDSQVSETKIVSDEI